MSDDFLPFGRQSIDDDDIAAVVEVLRSDYLTTGPRVAEFERALADRVGARHAVAVANGTAALHVACLAAGLKIEHEVIVPAISFVATANCVRYRRAEPVFVDVDPDSGLILPEAVDAALTERTRAIIPVHLTGRPASLEDLQEVAEEAGLLMIEDAAHALGATYRERPIGDTRWSEMAIFSFHPVKHVTTGEGGAVVTNDDELAERLRRYRNHGMVRDPRELERPSPGPWYYEQQVLGYNYRITDVQCALGLSQLRKLDRFLERRRTLAARYDRLLAELPLVRPVAEGTRQTESAYYLYSVLIDFRVAGRDRASVMDELRKRGVGTQVHYIPIPTQPYYQRRGWQAEDFPGAMAYYERTLSLPLYPAMADTDVDRVVEALAEVLGGA